MLRIAYVNGRYVPHDAAAVHIEDRGYQFADSVYEVCEVARGNIVDMTRHLNRLDRSLSELEIAWPMHRSSFQVVIREVVSRNRVRNGLVYLQVSRGVAPRDFPFPAGVRSSLVVTSKSLDASVLEARATKGIAVLTTPETRWERVDIKSTGLLPNVLAKQKARRAGAFEAWFVDRDGMVKEGSSSNAWIVTQDGVLVTRQANHGILRGVTRTTLIQLAEELGLKFEERYFTVEEAQQAREAFITSATTIVLPVVEIDGKPVANGHPGSMAALLRSKFFDIAEKTPS